MFDRHRLLHLMFYLGMISLIIGISLTSLVYGQDQHPPKRAPDAKAPPAKVHAWTTKSGLRYTWTLPKDYNAGTPRRLIVICHGTGLDYRWGSANHPAGEFRPDDIVVSLDGPSPGNNSSRLFLGKPEDARMVKEFIDEMRSAFSISRVYLYGHSQGGFFVIYFASLYPDQVNGVVAHASGAWAGTKLSAELKNLPIAFLHGSADPVVPYQQSPATRNSFEESGFKHLLMRRMEGYNHWPNALRTSECLTWCDGMSSDKTSEVLAAVRELLAKKGKDQYQYELPPASAAARSLLRRFDSGSARVLTATVSEKNEIARWTDEIEKRGKAHVDVLRKSLPAKRPWTPDGKPWIGHLICLAEDYRGVDSFSEFLKSIEYEKLTDEHSKAAGKLIRTFNEKAEKDPAGAFRAVVQNIASAALYDGLAGEFDERMKAWRKDAARLKLSKKDLADYQIFENYLEGYHQGVKTWRTLEER